MEKKKNLLTLEGLKALEQELEYLSVAKRQEIAEKLQEARAQGDLSENAEYDAAKDEQRDIEARIEEIKNILKNAEVVEENEFDKNSINFGSTVKVLDIELNEEHTFKIVGSTEADILNGKISNESPLGLALLKKKKGNTVKVEAPNGTFSFKIVDIIKPKKKEVK